MSGDRRHLTYRNNAGTFKVKSWGVDPSMQISTPKARKVYEVKGGYQCSWHKDAGKRKSPAGEPMDVPEHAYVTKVRLTAKDGFEFSVVLEEIGDGSGREGFNTGWKATASEAVSSFRRGLGIETSTAYAAAHFFGLTGKGVGEGKGHLLVQDVIKAPRSRKRKRGDEAAGGGGAAAGGGGGAGGAAAAGGHGGEEKEKEQEKEERLERTRKSVELSRAADELEAKLCALAGTDADFQDQLLYTVQQRIDRQWQGGAKLRLSFEEASIVQAAATDLFRNDNRGTLPAAQRKEQDMLLTIFSGYGDFDTKVASKLTGKKPTYLRSRIEAAQERAEDNKR